MSTPAQIQAARANGARSRGPITPEGKQKSSRNATRHGLLSNTVVLEGESKDRFEELLASFTAEVRPRNTFEAALVETMAVAHWRWLRVLSIHKAQFDMEMAREAAVPRGPVRAAIVFRKLSDNSRSLDVLLRYEIAFERQFFRALNTLMKFRAAIRTHNTQRTAHPEPEMVKFPIEPAKPSRDAARRGDEFPTPHADPACNSEHRAAPRPAAKIPIFQTNPIPRVRTPESASVCRRRVHHTVGNHGPKHPHPRGRRYCPVPARRSSRIDRRRVGYPNARRPLQPQIETSYFAARGGSIP